MDSVEALVAELRAGLDKVTPGPWRWDGEFSSYIISNGKLSVCELGSYSATREQSDRFAANARHLRRCSPDNIAALLDHLEAISSENERLKADLAFADEQTKKLEALLEPHIKWDDAPVRSSTEEER